MFTVLVGGRTGGVREHPCFIDAQSEEDGRFLIINGEVATGRDCRRQFHLFKSSKPNWKN